MPRGDVSAVWCVPGGWRAEAAETAIAEACGIAGRLGCQPLLDRPQT